MQRAGANPSIATQHRELFFLTSEVYQSFVVVRLRAAREKKSEGRQIPSLEHRTLKSHPSPRLVTSILAVTVPTCYPDIHPFNLSPYVQYLHTLTQAPHLFPPLTVQQRPHFINLSPFSPFTFPAAQPPLLSRLQSINQLALQTPRSCPSSTDSQSSVGCRSHKTISTIPHYTPLLLVGSFLSRNLCLSFPF